MDRTPTKNLSLNHTQRAYQSYCHLPASADRQAGRQAGQASAKVCSGTSQEKSLATLLGPILMCKYTYFITMAIAPMIPKGTIAKAKFAACLSNYNQANVQRRDNPSINIRT